MRAVNSDSRRIVPILVGSFLAALACAWVLTGWVGPTDIGVSCARAGTAECRVLQTRLLGLVGNSSFALPESQIRGARTIAPIAHGGGHGRGAYRVALVLDPAARYPEYPVVSYDFKSDADAATAKLNAYFNDRTTPSVELRSPTSPLVKIELTVMALIGLLAFVLIRRARSRTGA